ncbi:MAG: hypothetical protein ACFE96_00965, partial [Candidatus Hermodarchaeota archaeon]
MSLDTKSDLQEGFLSKREAKLLNSLYAVFFILFILSKVFPYGDINSWFIQGAYYVFNEYNIVFPFFEVVEIAIFVITYIELDRLKIHHALKIGTLNCVIIALDILVIVYIGPFLVFGGLENLSFGFY